VSKCECCGLAEECTAAYMEKTKALFCVACVRKL
jgi:hypothetical protein